ncbi:MAG TPA: hypothetical protein ENL42_04120, partial [Thermoplasmatales archaeon]|nr:hypothetical protein [Thermoplasmatales archaeon]
MFLKTGKMLTKIIIISALSFTLFISSTYFNIENIGNGEWEKFYENGAFYSIIKCNDSYILVGDKYYENAPQEIVGQGWMVKIDKDGNLIWEKTYGSKNASFSFARIIKDSKYFIIAGSKSYGNGDSDFWVVKVDEDGNEIWNKTYGSEENDFLRSIIKTEDGYLLCG